MKVLIVMTDEASVVALREQIGLVIANRYPALNYWCGKRQII